MLFGFVFGVYKSLGGVGGIVIKALLLALLFGGRTHWLLAADAEAFSSLALDSEFRSKKYGSCRLRIAHLILRSLRSK